jgi:uncharacterized DUF497 family protein
MVRYGYIWYLISVECEWDLAKDLANQKKHHFSFLEATECFSDPKGIELVDAKHSHAEKDFIGSESLQKARYRQFGTRNVVRP